MLEIKSICEVEMLKNKYGIEDKLVKLNCGYIMNEISKYNYEMDYISLYLNSIENLDTDKVVEFFNNALKNDITKKKFWVSYLDIHMEGHCAEDGEIMYSYSSKIKNCPLAISGSKKEVYKAIKTIIHASNTSEKHYGDHKNGIPKSVKRSNLNNLVVSEFNGDVNKFCKFIISKLELNTIGQQLLNDNDITYNKIDRVYYEQRPYECRI
jgi:hypothetical protein